MAPNSTNLLTDSEKERGDVDRGLRGNSDDGGYLSTTFRLLRDCNLFPCLERKRERERQREGEREREREEGGERENITNNW